MHKELCTSKYRYKVDLRVQSNNNNKFVKATHTEQRTSKYRYKVDIRTKSNNNNKYIKQHIQRYVRVYANPIPLMMDTGIYE